MASRTFQSNEDIPQYESVASDEAYAPQDFTAGERICPLGRGRRRHRVLRAAAVIAVALGLGSAWVKAPEDWKHRLAFGLEAMMSRTALHSAGPAVAPPGPVAADPPAALPVPETREIAAVPGAETGTPVPAMAAAEPRPAEGEADTADPKPLPPPVVDPADPYQKRAVAVGLHPDLSRSLLSRLSDADYKNAGVAIKAALAEAASSKVYAWPKEGGGKIALFEVRFVRAASPECRRYVVTVTLARWSTTAPAMEKCGNRKSE